MNTLVMEGQRTKIHYTSNVGSNSWAKEKFMEKNGAYDLEGVIWHQHSNRLMKKILELWTDKEVSVVDIGCGHNFYVSVLNYAGYTARGVDLVYLGHSSMIGADVTKPLHPVVDSIFGGSFDWEKPWNRKWNVLSLEVGEHLPYDKSEGYLDNLCSFGGDIIMSWAVPGQAGVGHINCWPNDRVVREMRNRNYMLRFDKTNELREAVRDCHCSWFKNTLMYFQPEKDKI